MKPGRFELKVGPRPGNRWSWADFIRLPISKVTRDFPCITKWSKFDAAWEGVTVDELLADAGRIDSFLVTSSQSAKKIMQ